MYRLRGLMFILLLISLVVYDSFAISVHVYSDPLEGLDDYIRKSMAEWQVPGLAIAIVKDDSIVFMKGFGVRETGKKALVDEMTIFPLGSTTKSFTAHAVAILVDEGKVSWDDPVVKHLPWFQLPDPWVTREVTIRDLLAHRVAGDMMGTPAWIAWCASSREEVLKNLRYLEPRKPRFRSEFYYSNEGYMTAGEVVAAASGKSWGEFIETHIFDQLGMTSATSSYKDLWDEEYLDTNREDIGIENAKVNNIVMGHYSREEGSHPGSWWDLDIVGPAGSICMNIQDWAKWLQLMIGKGTYQGKKLLSSEVIEEMHAGQTLLPRLWINMIKTFDPSKAMGLGWFVGDYRGHKILSHGGGSSGCLSFHVLMPEEKLGIAVLTNAYSNVWGSNRLPWALPFKVLDAYLGGPEHDWSSEVLQKVKAKMKLRKAWEKSTMNPVTGTKPSLPISDYAGTYIYRSLFEMKITIENDRLVLYECTGDEWVLEHWHHDTFRATPRNPGFYTPSAIYVSFILDATGRIGELKLRDVVFKREKARSKE